MVTSRVMSVLAAVFVIGAVACETDDPSDERDTAPAEADGAVDTAADSADGSEETGDVRDADVGGGCDAPNCVADRFRVPPERDCDSPADERPARCDEAPATFDGWGPASAVSRIEFQSEEAQDCCFNLDGSADGSNDNAFGELIGSLPIDVDRQLQANLEAGTFVALGEYQGLEDLDNPEDLEGINVYLGVFGSEASTDYIRKADPSCRFTESACPLETTPGQRFLVNPTILDDGTHPEVQFSNATLSGSTLEAGPANLIGQFNVPDLGRHRLRVRGATFEATVDREASSVEDGLVIEESRIGGYVLVRDLIELLNDVVGHCDCLGHPDDAVTYPTRGADDPDYTTQACDDGTAPRDECRVQCKQQLVDLERCSQISNVVCGRFPEFCLIVDTLARRADLDTDGDGQLDALSFGAIYEMTGARIGGVSDYLRATDTRIDAGGNLRVDRVFTNRDGWLAAFGPSGDGLELLGHTALAPGNHVGPTLDLSESVTESRSVQLVPYADDGPEDGTFEPEEDSQLRYFPNGGRIADQIRVTPR